MATTSTRTLRLLTLLQAQRDWPGPVLADRLGVSARTLRRDMERLRELGYPVRAARGVDGGYQLEAGVSLPPLALDDDEAVALAVGLQAATTSGVTGMAEPSLRVLTKVVQVMPTRLRRHVETLRAMTVTTAWASGSDGLDPSVLVALAQACRAAQGLTLEYRKPEGLPSERRVEPHRLVVLGRRWYLVAYDLNRHAWRSFRVDRITSADADGRRFRPRDLPADDAAAFVREGIRAAPWNHDVSATLHSPAAAVRPRLSRGATVQELPDDRCRLSMRTESLEWAALALGSAGAELSDVRPPELLALLREWSARFARTSDASSPSR